MYNKDFALYGFNQHHLTNKHYYDQFNTNVDVVESMGIIIQQRVLMEETTQETFNFFYDLSSYEKI